MNDSFLIIPISGLSKVREISEWLMTNVGPKKVSTVIYSDLPCFYGEGWKMSIHFNENSGGFELRIQFENEANETLTRLKWSGDIK